MPKFRKVRKSGRHLVHCLAQCSVCGWMEDDYMKAARMATKHVKETGHKVTIDQGIVYYLSEDKSGE